jgi:chromosome segregation and condensation protein ScpB
MATPKILDKLPPDVRAHANPLLSRIRDKSGAANSLARLYTWGQGKQVRGQDLRDLLLALVAAELLDQDDEFKAKGRAVLISESDTFTITPKGIARLEAIGQPTPPPALRPSSSPAAVAAVRAAVGLPTKAVPVPPPAPTEDEPTAPTIPPPPASEEIEHAPESGERTAPPPVAENDDTMPVEESPQRPAEEPKGPHFEESARPYASLTDSPPAAVHTAPAGLPVWLRLSPEQLRRAAEIVEELSGIGRRLADLVAREGQLLDEAAQLDAGLPVAAPVIPEAPPVVAAEQAPPAPAVTVEKAHAPVQRLSATEARVLAAVPADGTITLQRLYEVLRDVPNGTISGALAKIKSRGLVVATGRATYQRAA